MTMMTVPRMIDVSLAPDARAGHKEEACDADTEQMVAGEERHVCQGRGGNHMARETVSAARSGESVAGDDGEEREEEDD